MLKNLIRAKKGFLGGPTGYMITGILGLFVISLLLFALALTSATMRTSTSDTTALNVIGNTTAGTLSFAAFTPVLWIIVGVTGLIGFIVGGIIIYFKQN